MEAKAEKSFTDYPVLTPQLQELEDCFLKLEEIYDKTTEEEMKAGGYGMIFMRFRPCINNGRNETECQGSRFATLEMVVPAILQILHGLDPVAKALTLSLVVRKLEGEVK